MDETGGGEVEVILQRGREGGREGERERKWGGGGREDGREGESERVCVCQLVDF